MPLSQLVQICSDVSLIALVDWCNLPHASGIWRGILEDIIKPGLPNKPKLFFDLADPFQKSVEKIQEIVNLIKDFGPYAKITLGLSENEALRVFQALSGKTNKYLKEVGEFLMEHLQIDYLLIHPIDSCLLFSTQSSFHFQGRLVKN
ncbi:MAG: hypothetical protein ACI8UX_001608 [Psychromonas sp.]